MSRVVTHLASAAVMALVVAMHLCGLARAQIDDIAALNQRVVEFYQAGKYAEAIPVAEKSLELTSAQKGEHHLDTATTMGWLGVLYQAQGRLTDAEPLYKRVLERQEMALPAGHPGIAKTLSWLASLYQAQGRFTEAEPLFERALGMLEKALPAGHPDTMVALVWLASLYEAEGRLVDAEPLYKRVLERQEMALPAGHPDIATSLNNLGSLYNAQKRFSEAEPLLKRALDIYEKTLAADHANFATSLNNLAYLYNAQGRFTEAEPLYRRALEMRDKALPAGHLDIAKSLRSLALLYRELSRFAEAEPLFKRALEIREKALPGDHSDILESLSNLAFLYYAQGRFTAAESLYRRVLDIREKALPAGHPDIANTLSWLASLYQELGRFTEAEPLYIRALEMREKALPAGHLDIAKSLNDMAHFYSEVGRFAEAEPLLKRALDIYDKALPAGHEDFAVSLNNLASLYQRQGLFREAEPLFKRALGMMEKTLGLTHPTVAFGLDNLAGLYLRQGRLAEAEPLYKRVLDIREKALPAGHPDIAFGLNNLAYLYSAQGQLTQAEHLYTRALEVRDKGLGAEHPLTAASLANLAFLYQKQGRLTEAEPLYKQALDMRERALPAGHPEIAGNLNNLAFLYQAQGRLTEAEPLYKRALEMLEKALPAGHPDIARSLNNLAFLYYAKGAWEVATNHARRASTIIVERAKRVSRPVEGGATETATLEISQNTSLFGWLVLAAWPLSQERPALRAALSEETYITAQRTGQTSTAAALAQMASRFAKGEGELSRLVREQQNLINLWQQLDKQIVSSRALAPEHRIMTAESALVARLTDVDRRLVTLNTYLAKEFPEYAAVASPEPLSFKATQEQLRSDEALLQFTFAGREVFAWLVTRELARWVRLADTTANIRAKVHLLRCGLDRRGEWQWVKDKRRWFAREETCAALRPDGLLSSEPPPFDMTTAHVLYETLFGQLKDDIKGKHLLIVPSGSLTTLPFHVLVTEKPTTPYPGDPAAYGQTAWLAKSNAITVLPLVASLKSLASAGRSAASNPYVAFGNPRLTGDPENAGDADRAEEAASKQTCPNSLGERVASALGFKGDIDAYFRGGLANVEAVRHATPLPESADEICAVARELIKTPEERESAVYLSSRASERTLKALSASGELKRYRIVHFATHGLLAGETARFNKSGAEPSLIMTPPDTASEEDDGLLTASEVAELDLNADWVILSACNTAGASDTLSAEALSGLARAFFYAGARSLLVSHWYVDSDGAVKLVTRAIAELHRDPKIGRAEALRRAMLALMVDTSRPASSMPAAHPAIWAPFVVVGGGGR